ncbi:transcriptional regulatory [Fusarium acutatum]|uniref:Transcriptional regulatory n=1 Tax=Fusarium acutatum TaxID=78861 RepID=A0A8H4NEZ6_9HYPO|nr:transcriptional regulatory [Fusarium acutatum]
MIPIPTVAAQYNDEMNHVDRGDQIRSYTMYEHRFRCGLWQALLWSFLLEVALTNSFILQKKTRHPCWKPYSTLRAWKECICNAIFNTYAAKGGTRKRRLARDVCDIERPCTLCLRANTECIASGSARWRPYQRTPEKTTTANNSVRAQPGVTVAPTVESAWNSSSTVRLVEEAFQQHDAGSSEGVDFSALRSETWSQSKTTAESFTNDIVQPHVAERPKDITLQHGNLKSKPSAAEKELISLLPGLWPATLLVDNYFDRIHWFILAFHQDDFRRKFQDLYNHFTFSSTSNAPSRGMGFIAVLLAVFATSLHHIGAQEGKLKSHNVDPKELKDRILAALKSRFLDIISKGSLEAVQFCVLLASYYLYHGEPGMAWPLSGSGLRIAQALNLHRKMAAGDLDDQALNQQIQDRKRAWWAVYEIDTFCSMLYGFPLGFSDSDCNVGALDPYDEYSGSTKESRQTTGPTLLLYKCSMSELSAIVKSALVKLYGSRHDDQQRTNNPKGLFYKVMALNRRLQEWHKNLALKLRFDVHDSLSGVQVAHRHGKAGREFEDYLFRLQSLSLKLAYENAKILIHRPLLSFKMTRLTSTDTATSRTGPFQGAMQECREAALQISKAASTPYMLEASETYAMAFVSLHLLTAGVTLCMSITLDPLTSKSVEARSGLRQLMHVQTILKDKSIVAAQSLDITKRLMDLVMAKTDNDRSETGILSSGYPEVPQRDESESNLAPPEEGCSRQYLMPETNVDFNSPLIANNGSITDTLGMSLSDQDITLYADTSLNDTLLEYEQGELSRLSGE